MKPEDQIKALAELDGWTDVENGMGNCVRYGGTESESIVFVSLPNYLTSYDAIIPLVQKVCKERNLAIVLNAGRDGTWECVLTESNEPNCIPCDGDFYGAGNLCEACCEALLRATGKWTE